MQRCGDMKPLTSPQLFSTILIFSLIPVKTVSFCPQLCSCNDVNLSTHCSSGTNLKMVPIFLHPLTKNLSLSQNSIRDISMSLSFYSELRFLDLSQNSILSLGSLNFENLKYLQSLNASYNSVKELEKNSFTGLVELRILDLAANQLDKIHEETFENLENLKELILDRNKIENLDWDYFSSLANLERLSVKFNFIRVIKGGESEFLKNNGLFQLRELDLSWNQLETLKSQSFHSSPNLQTLNLCCNYIDSIENDSFITINNKIMTVSRLNLSQNRLKFVPVNSLSSIGSSLFELDLSSNLISGEIGSFSQLSALRRLKINENIGIDSISLNALNNNTHLVSFEANQLPSLSNFPLNILDNKPFLTGVSFQYSGIRTLPSELFSQKYSKILNSVDILGSPLDCNCSSYKLYSFVKNETKKIVLSADRDNVNKIELFPVAMKILDLRYNKTGNNFKVVPEIRGLSELVCATPSNLEGLKISELSPPDFSHCFRNDLFPSDYFELIVILLAAFVATLILLAISLKFYCVYKKSRIKTNENVFKTSPQVQSGKFNGNLYVSDKLGGEVNGFNKIGTNMRLTTNPHEMNSNGSFSLSSDLGYSSNSKTSSDFNFKTSAHALPYVNKNLEDDGEEKYAQPHFYGPVQQKHYYSTLRSPNFKNSQNQTNSPTFRNSPTFKNSPTHSNTLNFKNYQPTPSLLAPKNHPTAKNGEIFQILPKYSDEEYKDEEIHGKKCPKSPFLTNGKRGRVKLNSRMEIVMDESDDESDENEDLRNKNLQSRRLNYYKDGFLTEEKRNSRGKQVPSLLV